MGSVHGIWMGNFMGRWIYPNRDQTWQWKSHLFSAMMFPSKNLTFDRQNPSVPTCVTCLIAEGYPLVNIHKTMENHHLSWVNPLFLWAIFNSYVWLPKAIHGLTCLFSPCRGCDFWNSSGDALCLGKLLMSHVIQHSACHSTSCP